MNNLRVGSMGKPVKYLQIVLNTRITPSPRLRIDGVFGPRTQNAVVVFQRATHLEPDGIVGPLTWRALKTPVAPRGSASVGKFLGEMGTMEDFVKHVADEERRHPDWAATLGTLMRFFHTARGRRYLMIRNPEAVVDFRHFFAAAAESFMAGMSRDRFTVGLGGTRGDTLLLGVINEVDQCLSEMDQAHFNSCFAREDLVSNRLGAEFGRALKIERSQRSTSTMATLLQRFLLVRQPVRATIVEHVTAPTRASVAKEGFIALFLGIYDLVVPDAY